MAANRDKLLNSAQKHALKGNWEKALKDYRALVELDPKDSRNLLKVADIETKLGDHDAALISYRRVAGQYAADDFYEKAAAVYKQALRIAPDDPGLHMGLGEAYYRIGRLKDAVRSFHQAQKIYRAKDMATEQREVLERMVQVDPEEIGLKIQLAERYQKDDMRAESLALFRETAQVLSEEGRFDEYLQVAERIIFLEKTAWDLRLKVVRMYLDRGDNGYALRHLQVCFKNDPHDPDTLELLGLTFTRMGNQQKAVLVYQELGQIYGQQGQTRKAMDAWKSVLAIEPGHREARQALGTDLEDSGPMMHDTGAHEPVHTADALEGVEFLDDFGLDLESSPTYTGDQSGRPAADATREAAFVDRESPQVGVEPTSAMEDTERDSDITEERSVTGHEEIRQLLTESEVFLKYRLFDRATEVIQKAISLAPGSLAGHDQMRKLQEAMGDFKGAAQSYVEMAFIARNHPERAREYVRLAGERLGDSRAAEKMAARRGLQVHTLDPIELAPEFISEISEGISEVSESIQEEVPEVGSSTISPETHELDFMQEANDFIAELESIEDFTMDDIPLATKTVPDREIEDELLEVSEVMDIDDEVAFDENELHALDAPSEGFEFVLSADDADKMFDELFGETDDESSDPISEIDMFIADDDVELMELAEVTAPPEIPDMPSVDNSNPFGERSLSMKFSPDLSTAHSDDDVDVVIPVNTNFEMGTTYMEMGLYEAARGEFELALDDPDASHLARLQMAVCEVEMGMAQAARDRLSSLSDDHSAPPDVRRDARQKLEDLMSEVPA